jgi:hypothetical protein
VARFDSWYYLEAASGGLRKGIMVYAPLAELTLGHQYLVVGNVREAGDASTNAHETEMDYTSYVVDEGVAAIPSPVAQDLHALSDASCDAGASLTTGEDLEGVLVEATSVKCTANQRPGESFRVTTPSPSADTIRVVNFGGRGRFFTFQADSNEVVNVRGILHVDSGGFEICPRSNADIDSLQVLAAPGDRQGQVSFRVFPNPGRSPRVTFVVPKTGPVDLRVYDVAGRLVAVLANGVLPAGVYTRAWDGRSRQGDAVGPGVYFYRLRIGSETRVDHAVKLE